jgi:hypothetical protein
VKPSWSKVSVEETTRVDCVRVVGDILAPGSCVYWDLVENASAKTGVPSFIQTAVLLKRRRNEACEPFKCTVQIDANISGVKYAWRRAWWRLTNEGRNCPLYFNPYKSNGCPGPYEGFQNEMAKLDLDSISEIKMDEPPWGFNDQWTAGEKVYNENLSNHS